MNLEEILTSIGNIKLIKPSSEYIPVRVGDLEILQSHIRKLEAWKHPKKV
jgi:hypothetical protein